MSTHCRRGGVNDGAGNSTTSSFTHQLPSELIQTDSVSVEQTTEKVKPFTTTESNSAMVEQNTNNKYQNKLHEKLAALQVKTKRMTYDLEKTKEIIDLNNLDTSKVILSDIRAMINANNSNKQVGIVNDNNVVEALKPNSLVYDESSLEVKFHGGPCDDEIEEEEEEGWRPWNNEKKEKNNKNSTAIIEFEKGLEKVSGCCRCCKLDIDNYYPWAGLNEIEDKIATAGWFVSQREAILLAHDDASCSYYYDIAISQEKSVYNPPDPIDSSSIWGDCWLISVQGLDGCAETFVVAASAGNTMDSGFCSWDFDTQEVKGFQLEVGATFSRAAHRQQRTNSAGSTISKARQWWYKPCGPLIISTCTSQNGMKIFDIRDGDQVMRWQVQKPVVAMEYSSPLQWRDKGKVVVAEAESISLWDVNTLSTQPLVSVPFVVGKQISALHVNNTDAEPDGGVRRRVSSSEAEGNDGVFCTTDSINILDFRQPSGVGLKIPKDRSVNVDSVFSRGDSIYLGYTRSTRVKLKQPLIQQFSLRKQGLFCTYAFPAKRDAEPDDAISQIWVNSDIVMGVCGVGLYVFDALNDDALRVPNNVQYHKIKVRRYKEFYRASFDYMGSHALLIPRDKPAMWKHVIV